MSKHVIKFFPAQKAFVISPAPKNGFKSINGHLNAEWIFENDAELEIEWDKNSGKVTDPCLVFKSLSDSHRDSPVVAIAGGEMKKNKFIIKSHDCGVVKIKMATDGHHWGFDFTCKLNGEDCKVDPEMRIGTGENS